MIQEKITFQDSTWINLSGILSRPNYSYDFPVIICCHGFTSNKDRSSYTSLEKKLIDAQFAVFRYDAYGHGDSEGELWDITLTKAVDWCIQAVFLMKKKWFVQIWLMWSSFWWCTVLNAAQLLQEQIFAICAKAPVSDYALQKRQKLWEEDMQQWKDSWYTTYKSWSRNKSWELKYAFYEDMQQHNIHKKAHEIQQPICIIHGDKDVTVDVKQSMTTDALLVNSELHIFSWTDHFFKENDDQDRANTIFVSYFMKKLWNQ